MGGDTGWTLGGVTGSEGGERKLVNEEEEIRVVLG